MQSTLLLDAAKGRLATLVRQQTLVMVDFAQDLLSALLDPPGVRFQSIEFGLNEKQLQFDRKKLFKA